MHACTNVRISGSVLLPLGSDVPKFLFSYVHGFLINRGNQQLNWGRAMFGTRVGREGVIANVTKNC